jgi:predicted O-methyltransferase YrrM
MPIDPQVLKAIDELDALRKTRDDHWQIPREEGELLFQIAVSSGARKIVELGTSYGFSGLFWGAAAKQTGGILHTIDIDKRKFDLSKETFRQAGLGEVIVNYLGDAMAVGATIPGPIDIGFIDAFEKKLSQKYFEMLWSRIRIGGSILVDNTRTHPEELADYIRFARSRSDATSAGIPVGNGFEWTIKVRQS